MWLKKAAGEKLWARSGLLQPAGDVGDRLRVVVVCRGLVRQRSPVVLVREIGDFAKRKGQRIGCGATPRVVQRVVAEPGIIIENQPIEVIPLIGRVVAGCVMEELACGDDTIAIATKM